MGVDALDLCFRLEKEFGVHIEHDAAPAILFDTPGTILRYLMAILNGECQKVPAIEPLYISVDTAVAQSFGSWKSILFRSLNKRSSPDNRESKWHSLENELGVALPKLEILPGEVLPVIPRQYDSSLSLSYWIAEHHPERVKKWVPIGCKRSGKMAIRVWTEDEAWETLCECIVGVLGVRREQVTRDARMVEDLGMD